MQHLDEGTVHAWLDGALAGDEVAAVAKHVAECRECAAMVAEARGMIAAAGNIISALDGVRGGVIPAGGPLVAGQRSLWRRLRFTPARAALAATLLIAIATMLTVRSVPRPGVPATTTSNRQIGAPGTDTFQASRPVAPAVTASTSEEAPRASGKATTSTRRVGQSIATPANQASSPAAELATKALTPDSTRKVDNAPRLAADSVASAVADRAVPPLAPSTPANLAGVANAGASPTKAATDARAAARDRQASRVLPLEEVIVTGAVAATSALQPSIGGTEGCYQIRADSASSALAAGFPLRFALVSGGQNAQRVVRAVSAEGRIDSIVPGGAWQRLAPDVVHVWFANVREQQPRVLQLGAGAFTNQANAVSQVASLPVVRIECRR